MSIAKLFARRFAALMAFLAMSLGLLVVGAAPASAGTSQGIDMVHACAMTHGTTPQLTNAAFRDPYNPYTWYCLQKVAETSSTSLSVSSDKSVSATAEQSAEWQPLGGVDTQLYCSTKHPGTRAVVGRYYGYADVYSWSCVS